MTLAHFFRRPSAALYVNPFRDLSGIIPERIDMGVDYACKVESPLLALGAGGIKLAGISGSFGWPGDGFVLLQLSDGPYAGRFVFYAENIRPRVSTGERVTAGQSIADLLPAFPNCEVGWSSGNFTETLAHALHQQAPGDPGGWPSAAGASFATLCVALGAPLPIKWGQPVHGVNPPGLPIPYHMPSISVFPLVQGMFGPRVRQVQRALQARSYAIKADSSYGPATAASVSSWQRAHKRKVTGEVSQADWDFMFPVLHPGTSSSWPGTTMALQRVYNHEYRIHTKIDGNYGPGMVHATEIFQTNHRLHPDGIVGPNTWETIFQ